MTRRPDWDVANDALVVERLLASSVDPVTNRATPISLSSECTRMRAEDAVVTVVTLAYDTPTTRALPGRARGLDVAERALCRELERWADPPGAVVAIGEAASAYIAMTTPEEARGLRDSLPALANALDRAPGPVPLVSAAQGPSRESSDVVARAIARLVLPRGTLPAQDRWSATGVARRPLWDVRTGSRFGSQVRLHAHGLDGPHAERAEGLMSVTRSPRFTDAAVATSDAVRRLVDPVRDDAPVVWDASAILSSTGLARPALAQVLVDHCPPRAWIGVAAWFAGVDEVLSALRTLRTSGHSIVLTGYGSGREPLAALDELPVDAVLLDEHLERGARIDSADRAVLLSVLDHAARNEIQVLTATRQAIDLHRHPVPSPAPRVAAPGGQLLDRARLVGLTLRETAVLVNATHGQGPLGQRWDRYDVALHWARAAAS